MNMITEPARNIPVTAEADVCVLGGSCTGVFAAVRAARLGMRVILIEKAEPSRRCGDRRAGQHLAHPARHGQP